MKNCYAVIAQLILHATAMGSVHPIAGITSFLIKSIICFLSDSIITYKALVSTKVENSFLSNIH